jgi:hypothetical protein
MHIQAALYAISLHNLQTYKRISSRSTPVSAEAGLHSQPFARNPRQSAAAGSPRFRVEASL